jgi:alcohol dehydrogenase (cytochrome c)
MRGVKTGLGLAFAAGLVCGLHPISASAQNAGQLDTAREIGNYTPVTQQRLENPEPGNWILYRRTYNWHGFSPLNQINAGNVKGLMPVWTMSTGVIEGHEAPPLVNNGVMFVATPQDQVIAVDAKTGDVFWRYKAKLPEDLFQLHPTSRGVGFWGDRVFLAQTDDRLVALDARTGKVAWNTKVDDYTKGYYLTLMPLVVDGKVIGTSGGEFGVRGYIAAYDANDGHQLWRQYTVPAPGEPGHDTWKSDAWKTGGGGAWIGGTYDPASKSVYWGVGNPSPWPGPSHPGDNLFTTSTIAFDPDSGKIKSHFQYTWNDSWDWDEIDPPLLVDLNLNGNAGQYLVHPARDGYLWVLKQGPEQIDFVAAQKFVNQNAFTGIDPKTGRASYDPEHKPTIGKMIHFCPSLWGGKDWPSASYADSDKVLVIPAQNDMCGQMEGRAEPYTAGQLWLGTDPSALSLNPIGDHIGELQGWDLNTGKKLWQHNYPTMLFASVLTTAGDLTFVGGSDDRYFRAFNTKTGELLWQLRLNSGIIGMPSAFSVDGKEYIAIQAGWGVDGQRITDGLSKTKLKVNPDAPQGGVVWVFAVNQ